MPQRPDLFPIRLFAATLCVVAAGCASPEKPPAAPPPVEVAPQLPIVIMTPPPPVDPIGPAARRLTAHHERLRQLPAPALADEVARFRAVPASTEANLELAMALGLTRNPGDAARAMQLLEPLLISTDPVDEPWRAFARMLSAGLAEQRRLEELVERQVQQLREGQRRLDQVNEKLEALKAIERSLGSRPAPATPPRDTP